MPTVLPEPEAKLKSGLELCSLSFLIQPPLTVAPKMPLRRNLLQTVVSLKCGSIQPTNTPRKKIACPSLNTEMPRYGESGTLQLIELVRLVPSLLSSGQQKQKAVLVFCEERCLATMKWQPGNQCQHPTRCVVFHYHPAVVQSQDIAACGCDVSLLAASKEEKCFLSCFQAHSTR
jgi:hypothetical protein